jgi:hypothetical protein
MVHTHRPGDTHKCKKCSSSHCDVVFEDKKQYLVCLDCGKEEALIN